MLKTTNTDILLAGQRYELTTARLGDSSYQQMLGVNWLLFPPSFTSAADMNQYHEENKLGNPLPLAEAKALMFFANTMLSVWPQNAGTCKSFITTWSNQPLNISKSVARSALQDYALAKNTIESITHSADRNTDYTLFRYWFGLRAVDPTTGKVNYYPSISEISSYSIPNLNGVSSADGTKDGTIVQLLRYDDSPTYRPQDVVVSVEVKWDDGTTTKEPYTNIIHMTPQGKASSRIQDYLGAYRNGLNNIEEKTYNDIPEKMAVMMVYMAFAQRKNPTISYPIILKAIVENCSNTQQPANLTDKYMSMKEIDATGTVVAYGWNSNGNNLGFNICKEMWTYVSNNSTKDKVASWGAFPAKFLDDIEQYHIGEVKDTGLVVCPHCKVCDYLKDANFIDFGVYFGADDNALTSVTCAPVLNQGVYLYQAVGVVECSHCSKGYYRKFQSKMRSLVAQMPIGENELKLRKSYASDWVIRSPGNGARMGEMVGYMFRDHVIGEIPSLIIYLSYAGVIKSVEYPLEIGSMSRRGLKELVCTGTSLKEGIQSHTYYDNVYAPSFTDSYSSEVISQKGMGLYRGPQADWSGVDSATGTKSCRLCDKVGVDTTLGEGTTYQNGARLEMIIDRGDGSQTFDRPDIDFFVDTVEYYKIRLTTPRQDMVRYLDVRKELVGVPIGTAPALISMKSPPNPCVNDIWLNALEDVGQEYVQDLEIHKNLSSEMLVCEGLAWSGRYEASTRKWLISEPQTANYWVSSFDSYEGVAGVIDTTTWTDGENKWCSKVGGTSIPRFPAHSCADKVTYVSPFASCSAVQPLMSSHEIVVDSIEFEDADTPTGKITTKSTYSTCNTCKESFTGSPSIISSNQFVIPHSTDPTNTPPVDMNPTGIYNPTHKWHFTRFLYEPYNKTIDDLVGMDDIKEDVKKYIPKNIYKWLKAGRRFPSTTSATPVVSENESQNNIETINEGENDG